MFKKILKKRAFTATEAVCSLVVVGLMITGMTGTILNKVYQSEFINKEVAYSYILNDIATLASQKEAGTLLCTEFDEENGIDCSFKGSTISWECGGGQIGDGEGGIIWDTEFNKTYNVNSKYNSCGCFYYYFNLGKNIIDPRDKENGIKLYGDNLEDDKKLRYYSIKENFKKLTDEAIVAGNPDPKVIKAKEMLDQKFFNKLDEFTDEYIKINVNKSTYNDQEFVVAIKIDKNEKKVLGVDETYEIYTLFKKVIN